MWLPLGMWLLDATLLISRQIPKTWQRKPLKGSCHQVSEIDVEIGREASNNLIPQPPKAVVLYSDLLM